MKKLLGVSIAAMLAVTPMMANAAGVNDREVDTFTSQQLANDTNIATTSYVKGAYNVLATELNNIGDDIDITANGNNMSTNDSIATNVATLDTKMGKVADLKSSTEGVITTGSVLKSVSGASDDLTKAVIAINNELAAKSTASTVANGNYVGANHTQNNTVAENFKALDDSIGQIDSSQNAVKNYVATMGTNAAGGEKTVAQNIQTLDNVIGQATSGTYFKAIATTDTQNTKTIATSLKDLDTQVVTAEGDIATLKGDVDTPGSVLNNIYNEAEDAEFTSSHTQITAQTVGAAINQVQANLNAANAASALENASAGGYYAAGANVNTAIVGVDAQVKSNQDAIAAINRTQIPLFGSWTTDAQTGNVTIATLTTNTPTE